MTHPRTTDPAALLLFVTEPQQLDAVFEYGTETLSPASIRVIPTACESCEERPAVPAHGLCPRCAEIAGVAEACEWCTSTTDSCADDCDCPPCEGERALDDDADARGHFA